MSVNVCDMESARSTSALRRVIAASAVGTIFEWYEFFLFGALASIIASQFFSGVGETAGFIFALLSFAAGFAMRPVGALLFGHIGDSRGRKVAFLTTIGVMGVATVLIGCLPVYSQVGLWSPVALIVLRLIQGIALGGEYGGAATYVAEQAPSSQRGLYTSLMHGAAALGLVLALGIIYICRSRFGEEVFRDFAWRIPFWFSTVILAVSLWARRSLEEPLSFQALKSAGELSKSPVREALGKWPNLRLILIALFGFMAADGAIWYTAHFYTQFFLERSLHVEPALVNLLFVCVASIGAPLYVLFGWLSDRVGRKPVIVSAIATALLTYLPLFHVLSRAANPALVAVTQSSPVTIAAFPGDCTLQLDLLGRGHFTSDCDRARRALSRAGISYTTIDVPSNTPVRVHIGATVVDFTSPANDIEKRLTQALRKV